MPANAFDPTSMSLLQRARSNDQEAWHQIVHLYGPLVHKWCRRSNLKDDDLADVFQETFRSVSTHLKTFSPAKDVGSFRSWLRTICRTKVADHFRKLNQQPAGQGGTDANRRMSVVPNPLGDDDEEEAGEDHALLVQRTMDLIKPEFSKQNWKAFLRVAIEGCSAVEVAESIGVNAQVVRQANYRIRRRLRLVLQDLIE